MNQPKPHPWEKRRKDVIRNYSENIIEVVTPFGYSEAYKPEDHDVATDELAWLQANQSEDLPPEWLTLRSNGLRGESLDALLETEDGQYTLADLIPEGSTMFDLQEGVELLGGMRRVEQFLKDSDYQKWMSGHVKRYALAVNDEGKRGLIPLNRRTSPEETRNAWERIKPNVGSVEEVREAMEWREGHTEQYTDAQGRRRTRYIDGTFRSREDVAAKTHERLLDTIEHERDLTEYRLPEGSDYAPAADCPDPRCSLLGDECSLCFGTESVTHIIGIDGAEFPPPGHEPVIARRATALSRKGTR